MTADRRIEKQRLLTWLVTALLPPLLRLVQWTWRARILDMPTEAESKEGGVFAHWHGESLFLLAQFRHRGFVVMVSRSRDGELMSRVLHKLGYRTVRGSTSRGGKAALKAAIDEVRHGRGEVVLAVDGPKGPIHTVKPGILKIAQATGRPIVYAASAARRRKVFDSWDACWFPYPFSRVVVCFGTPIVVPPDADSEALEGIRQRLETNLRGLRCKAEAQFGRSCEVCSPEETPGGASGQDA